MSFSRLITKKSSKKNIYSIQYNSNIFIFRKKKLKEKEREGNKINLFYLKKPPRFSNLWNNHRDKNSKTKNIIKDHY